MLKFSLGVDDQLAYGLYSHRHSPAHRQLMVNDVKRRLTSSAFFLLIGVGIGVFADRWFYLVVFIPLEVIILGVYFVRRDKNYERRLRNLLEKPGKKEAEWMTLSMDDEGITQSTAHETTTIKWSRFGPMVEDENHLYLGLGQSRAIIVPHRVFVDATERVAFVSQYERLRQAPPPGF